LQAFTVRNLLFRGVKLEGSNRNVRQRHRITCWDQCAAQVGVPNRMPNKFRGFKRTEKRRNERLRSDFSNFVLIIKRLRMSVNACEDQDGAQERTRTSTVLPAAT
jgi:hypothetical protein